VSQGVPLVVWFKYGSAWIRLVCIGRVKLKRVLRDVDHSYKTHGIRACIKLQWDNNMLIIRTKHMESGHILIWDELGMTWKVKRVLNEDEMSWHDLNNQTSLSEDEWSLHDLNSQISVEWGWGELAWLE